MFLFSKKHKTPISTYMDSYRPPCSVKKTVQDENLQPLWKENKFVTQSELLMKTAMQVYYRNTIDPTSYRNTIDPTSYRPWKYSMSRSEEKYSPVFVNEDKYVTWTTGPYNSAAWHKHSSYLPLLPKETRMKTYLHSMPTPYPLNLICFTPFEKNMVGDMHIMEGRGPLQGYYSPCSGRHYCLRGMDYYVDGSSAIRRHLYSPGERAVRSVPASSYSPRVTFCVSTHHLQPSNLYYYTSPRWDSSHFINTGGIQRGSYIIHPEFASEVHSAP
ncbi:SMRP1 protein, partial [Chloroceryle aenea]|nr:SMRP1 protein [Chloroceryle aenea]